MILLIDNYDSFVYNLARYVEEIGYEYQVVRNNEISVEDIKSLSPSHIIISPGPCSPNEAGISLELIEKCMSPSSIIKVPILGVCLGHQAIGQACKGKVVRAQYPMHGKSEQIFHDESGVFKNMPNPFPAARYHSLIVERETLPDCLKITAWTEKGEIMGIRHQDFPIFGVQFHPESILTTGGHHLLQNFLSSL